MRLMGRSLGGTERGVNGHQPVNLSDNVRLTRTLAMLLPGSDKVPLSWLRFGEPRAPMAERTAALCTPPLEQLPFTDPSGSSEIATMIVGNRQTKGALPVASEHFDAALFTHRGRGYARYNEDGAGLFRDERGHLYAAVFDQAGGLGGDIRGQASALAAEKALKSFRKIATGRPGQDIAKALAEGLSEAHDALVERRQGEVTTAVVAVAQEDTIILATSGDSAAIHLSAEGRPLDETVKHEHSTPYGVSALTHAVGLTPEGPNTQIASWRLDPGQWVIMCSDGLLDSGLPPEAWGEILSTAESAEAGVNTLAGRVLKRMTLLQAKPDNLTIVAFRRRSVRDSTEEK